MKEDWPFLYNPFTVEEGKEKLQEEKGEDAVKETLRRLTEVVNDSPLQEEFKVLLNAKLKETFDSFNQQREVPERDRTLVGTRPIFFSGASSLESNRDVAGVRIQQLLELPQGKSIMKRHLRFLLKAIKKSDLPEKVKARLKKELKRGNFNYMIDHITYDLEEQMINRIARDLLREWRGY